MLGHTFWNKENQCWLQKSALGNEKNKISRMTNDKKEAIFIRRIYEMKIKQKGKESQNSSAATGLTPKQTILDFPGGPVVKILCYQCRGAWVRSLVGVKKQNIQRRRSKNRFLL